MTGSDYCDRCGAALVKGEYGGGCEECDLLLCLGCEAAHGLTPCGGRFDRR